jgi:hypothetical protein
MPTAALPLPTLFADEGALGATVLYRDAARTKHDRTLFGWAHPFVGEGYVLTDTFGRPEAVVTWARALASKKAA